MITFTDDEKRLVLDLLTMHLHCLPATDPNLDTAASAFGRVSEGAHMTMAEIDAHLPKGWYISLTGRKLRHRADDEVPITTKRFAEITANAIRQRGYRQLGLDIWSGLLANCSVANTANALDSHLD